jgi:cadmium resistance protein CadD (predicted permease)
LVLGYDFGKAWGSDRSPMLLSCFSQSVMSIAPVLTAIAAFAATNFDDIIVLMVFFANVNANLRRRHIVVGQYLGFTALLLLSLPGLLGGWLVPEQWLALLGLLPIGFGVAQLLQQDEADAVQTVHER